jgi:hypothetical protein
VGVGVKGDGYRGVSQHLGDDLGIDVSRQEQRSARVPEVVEADGRKPGLPKERHEGPFPEVGGVYEGASLRGEDEPLILVEVADALHLLELTGEVIPESLYCRVREPHCSAASLDLGLTKVQAALATGQGSLHPKEAFSQVYVFPLETQQLTLPRSRISSSHERVSSVTSDG